MKIPVKKIITAVLMLAAFNTASDAQMRRVSRRPPPEPYEPITTGRLVKAMLCFTAAAALMAPVVTAETTGKKRPKKIKQQKQARVKILPRLVPGFLNQSKQT